MYYYTKYKYLILSIIINIFLKLLFNSESETEFNKCNYIEIYSIEKIFMPDIIVDQNSVLILENSRYHYECTPGFTKYFIDLGYNVDIILHSMGISSFCFFNPIKKIRLFFYESSDYLINNTNFFSIIRKRYNFRFVESTEPKYFELYQKIYSNKTFFTFHDLYLLNSRCLNELIHKNQIIGLANFSIGIKINPHYFGEFKTRKKNKITTFFITSTIYRNYSQLIMATKALDNEKKKFHIIVIGKIKTFSREDIPKNLEHNFTFQYQVNYSELYKAVYKSDFIIINLDPRLEQDSKFTKTRATGSAQLSYGFLKPVLVNSHFVNFYNFNDSNSIIHDNNNFTDAMRKAICMSNKDYKKLQENLSLLEKKIYHESIFNLQNLLFYS